MKTVLKANLATYLVIALTVLCAHLTEAKSKAVAGGGSAQVCAESVQTGPLGGTQILCEVSKDVYYTCDSNNCSSGGNPFSKMTWHKCGQPTATGAAGAQVKTVTGTLTYAIDHAVNVMGVRGTEPGVSGDHYYECSLAQNPQRSRCTGCHYQKLGPP
ncbi:hypothetical protein MJO28_000294 [Puccinia striiformis f. sp. tritici]|uniref:Uncharacterized protein n=1 Tax=Puccinia striiformis f. sp. tritici TaxID=168172 RepID=A0ACC0EZ79_9BASI|nr:hypothetical protein Pst134EA_000932 [Puccinia striiformis f. sp. tritici]KAI9600850.1 hypothetical protein H4Q26_000644 [Puccinia striiformis f. sp. tritici PST-130]KAH9467121.1 hypothetical protein Pst134EB_002149 [Puccinia striiformis f. sp. tritici]KAH9473870.1 hypothetical protein Pst134EA_000932 [Puccinia striiformis f. sp. tritici]KAI7962200.1 hypothetical protein MJO28_000294 [Puccinia striiformis f. sp. tritici]KAI7967653.1 hypothetical protein MJO29_000930 [Puccinia striiformis f.